jgi:hypothetical protein
MMDREQATEIQKHLLDAAQAMRRAEAAVFDVGAEARRTFAEPLTNIIRELQFGLLQVIYNRFPDLKPVPNEIPTIDSTLRWEDVHLPPSATEADVDSIIFSCLQPQWRKTAMIITRALQRCEELSLTVEPEVFSARIQALAEADRLDYQGDLRYWRFSEVRLQP